MAITAPADHADHAGPPAPPGAREDGSRRAVVVAIVVAVLAVAVGFGALLFDREPRLASSNTKVMASRIALRVAPGEERCQRGEYVPDETAMARLFAGSPEGTLPSVGIEFRQRDGTVVGGGRLGAGHANGPIAIPVDPPADDVHRGEICIANHGSSVVDFAGNLTAIAPDAVPAGNPWDARSTDEIRVDLLRGGREPLWRVLPEVARRYAVMRPSFIGPWGLPLAFGSFVVAAAIAVWLVARRPPGDRRAMRRTALGCVAATVLAALSWSLLLPTWQGPDEPVHFGYAELLADTGELPGSTRVSRLRELARPAGSQHWTLFRSLPFSVEGNPSWSEVDEAFFRELSAAPGISRSDPSAPGSAAGSPPLYYVPMAALSAAMDATPLERVFAMRVLSAMLAGLTALFAFLFAREVVPGHPRTWPLAAVTVGLQPMFSALSGGITNDTLLIGLATAAFYLVARCFRLGLSTPRAVALGAVLVLGDLAKSRMLLLVPGVAVALVAIVVRAAGAQRRRAARDAVVAGFTFAALEAAWFVLSRTVLERGTGVERVAGSAAGEEVSVRGAISYAWQYFLPRLPFMKDDFPRWPQYGVWDVYVQGFIGRFGFFQYGFTQQASAVIAAALGVVFVLAAVVLVRRQGAIRRRWLELASYGGTFALLLAFIAYSGYTYRAATGYNLEQPRYLFPCLALYGVVVASAALALGQKHQRLVATVLVLATSVHALFSLVVTVDRYWV
ncbi:MAG TPA: hypothetical protein VF230_10565 [Acidimicrobiales bacterium]